MSEDNLSQKAREALKHIRAWVMNNGRVPSVRELMRVMDYKSSRSPLLLLQELADTGFLQRREDGSNILIKDLNVDTAIRTIPIPLIGNVTCGTPILAFENLEAMVPVSVTLARPGNKYFLLRAKGDSMDKEGINNGDLILIKQQAHASNGDKVVALIDDEATVKIFRQSGNIVSLLPRSTNPKHQPIIVTDDLKIHGIVEGIIPKFDY